jgi:hypothetical protein
MNLKTPGRNFGGLASLLLEGDVNVYEIGSSSQFILYTAICS